MSCPACNEISAWRKAHGFLKQSTFVSDIGPDENGKPTSYPIVAPSEDEIKNAVEKLVELHKSLEGGTNE
jgi:hypothetical protein